MISSKNQWFITLPRIRFVTHLTQNFQTSSKGKYTKCIPIFYIIYRVKYVVHSWP